METHSRKRLVRIMRDKYEHRCTGILATEKAPRRIIVVVGAGMAHQTHLPLAAEAASEIESHLVLDTHKRPRSPARKHRPRHQQRKQDVARFICEASYTRARGDILQRTGIQEADFETTMEALCQGDAMEEAVRSELAGLYSSRHNITLSYEILAHLFELTIVDAIINFNFDEQLDDAIERNLRPAQYTKIISDGDYHPKGHKTGVYLKPHGTVGHPSSLRFRKVDYTLIPHSIIDAIATLLTPNTVFIVAGFSMKSIEFNELLRQHYRRRGSRPEFFIISAHPPDTHERVDRLFPGRDEILRHVWDLNARTDETDEDAGRDIIPRLFADLQHAVSDGKISPLEDRKYSEAIAHLFCNLIYDAQPTQKDPCDLLERQAEWLPTYLYLRTAVALIAAIARQKGRINLEAQGNTRLGALYRRYIDHCPRQAVRSLADICQDLGLRNYAYVRQLFKVPHIGDKTLEEWLVDQLQSLIETRRKEQDDVVSKQLLTIFAARVDLKGKDILKAALRQSADTYVLTQDIVHAPDNDVSVVYPSQKKYITKIEHWEGLRAVTKRLFEQPTWNELWLLAERGQWVFEQEQVREAIRTRVWGQNNIQQKIMIRMVVKGTESVHELRKVAQDRTELLCPGLLQVEIYGLPRSEHNRMLTCWVEKTNATANIIAAIYSHRNDEDSYISPVLIDTRGVTGEEEKAAKDDATFLKTLFEAYRVSAMAKFICDVIMEDKLGLDPAVNIKLIQKLHRVSKANIDCDGCEGVRMAIDGQEKTIEEILGEHPTVGNYVGIGEARGSSVVSLQRASV